MHQRYSKFTSHAAYVEKVKALLEQDQDSVREDLDMPGLKLTLTGVSLYDSNEDVCWLEMETDADDGSPNRRDDWVNFNEDYLHIPGSDLEYYYEGIMELYRSISRGEM